MSDLRDIERRPNTLREALGLLRIALSEEEKASLLATPVIDLIDLHFGLGTEIRNAFGLHGNNPELLADCGTNNADDASMKIIQALWARLRN